MSIWAITSGWWHCINVDGNKFKLFRSVASVLWHPATLISTWRSVSARGGELWRGLSLKLKPLMVMSHWCKGACLYLTETVTPTQASTHARRHVKTYSHTNSHSLYNFLTLTTAAMTHHIYSSYFPSLCLSSSLFPTQNMTFHQELEESIESVTNVLIIQGLCGDIMTIR